MKRASNSVAESRTKTGRPISRKAYISILAFMIKDLHLYDEELLAYAYIHGLNIFGKEFDIEYELMSLSFFLQCPEQEACLFLESLRSKELIDINKVNVFGKDKIFIRCRYFAEDFE